MTEEFAAPVLREEGGMGYHFLPVPPESAARLAASGTRRVVAVLNGHSVRRALVTVDGGPALILGQDLLRTIGAQPGDTVLVDASPDPEPDRIDLGDELEAVFADDAEAAVRFFGFTPGRQRSIATYVTGAKRAETRIKRALDLAHKLRTHTLYGDTRDTRDTRDTV